MRPLLSLHDSVVLQELLCTDPLLLSQALPALHELSPTGPSLKAHARLESPLQELFPTSPLLLIQADAILHEPLPMSLILSVQALDALQLPSLMRATFALQASDSLQELSLTLPLLLKQALTPLLQDLSPTLPALSRQASAPLPVQDSSPMSPPFPLQASPANLWLHELFPTSPLFL